MYIQERKVNAELKLKKSQVKKFRELSHFSSSIYSLKNHSPNPISKQIPSYVPLFISSKTDTVYATGAQVSVFFPKKKTRS